MQTDYLILSIVLWVGSVTGYMLWSWFTVCDAFDRREQELPKPAIPKLALPGFALFLLFGFVLAVAIIATMLYLPYNLFFK